MKLYYDLHPDCSHAQMILALRHDVDGSLLVIDTSTMTMSAWLDGKYKMKTAFGRPSESSDVFVCLLAE